MKRTVILSARHSLALWSRSASARALLREEGGGAGEGQGAGAAVRGGSDVPEAAAEPLVPGMTIGVGVDAKDHVWIVHRPDTVDRRTKPRRTRRPGRAASTAPPVLEFDQAGQPAAPLGRARARATTGRSRTTASPSTTKATSGSAATAPNDGHGPEVHPGRQVPDAVRSARARPPAATTPSTSAGRQDLRRRRRPTRPTSPTATATTASPSSTPTPASSSGIWGAYGNKPDDTNLGRYNPDAPPAQQFRTPVHCAELSNDGLVYVCDRPNNRIQVFKPDGTFVKEAFIAKNTLGDGSAWDIAFSKDPQQKYPLRRRRHEREGLHPRPRSRWRS